MKKNSTTTFKTLESTTMTNVCYSSTKNEESAVLSIERNVMKYKTTREKSNLVFIESYVLRELQMGGEVKGGVTSD